MTSRDLPCLSNDTAERRLDVEGVHVLLDRGLGLSDDAAERRLDVKRVHVLVDGAGRGGGVDGGDLCSGC